MEAATQIQDFIIKGGNVFFRVQDESSQKDYHYEGENMNTEPRNRVEEHIVQVDRVLLQFAESLVRFLQMLFAPKVTTAVASAPASVSNARIQAFSSSKRLVDKFDQQYQSANQPKPKQRKKGLGDYIELVLGIVVYGIYRLFKVLTFSK